MHHNHRCVDYDKIGSSVHLDISMFFIAAIMMEIITNVQRPYNKGKKNKGID